MKRSKGYSTLLRLLRSRGWKLQPFQRKVMEAFHEGQSGLLNAPTGSGKTYALWFPILVEAINAAGKRDQFEPGLQVLWITPLRALAKDLQRNMQDACDALDLPWRVGMRTGDVSQREKARQNSGMHEALIITPESLHLLFTQKNWTALMGRVQTVVVDEWHELMGNKRGVQTQLALAALRRMNPGLRTWGISATIGNLEEALQALLGPSFPEGQSVLIRAEARKKMHVETLLPERVETLPWAGYLGIRMLDQVVRILRQSRSTLIFTNTRSQTEIWYRAIIEEYPEFAGVSALHHGSLDRALRTWVEEALHDERLRFVVCTSSLDLGVDFEPVETVIQIGSPKSIARFVQRAGRSGHQPGAESRIYFLPTHALELIEAVSLREGMRRQFLEDREPPVLAFDVLAQWMVTRALGEGFIAPELFEEVTTTHCFSHLQPSEWLWLLGYITTGTPSLEAYDEFRKVEREGNLFVVRERKIATRHRLGMGTIVSDASLRVKYQQGKYLGTIEESFISRLKPGDVFSFAGRNLEFLRVREMTATVRNAGQRKGVVPQWLGGRMSLSSNLSHFIRKRLAQSFTDTRREPEIRKLLPLLRLQEKRSHIPASDEFLIEQYTGRDGHHIFMYPFEGRLVHEGMAALIAHRIGKVIPITFSLAMNDYGFELLSDQVVDLQDVLQRTDLFTDTHLQSDILASVNATEMARRKFREIASIAGLVFQGFPGKVMKTSQLQSSSSLLFEVMYEYERDNLFIRQAFQEVLDDQLAEGRLRKTLERVRGQQLKLVTLEKPGPLSFPILVDRLREQLSSEKLEQRIQKMIKAFGDED